MPPNGTMPLVAHLRELRQRLIKSLVAILVMTIITWNFYEPLLDILTQPFTTAIANLEAKRGVDAQLTFTGVGQPFTFQLKTSLVAGIVLASPVWLWQIWAFIVPALHKIERKWSLLFGAFAGPLFAAGVVLGYVVLPKGIEVLIGFTPEIVSNLVNLGDYLNFVLRTILVFGVAAEIPLFVILLNLVGVVSGRQLASSRPWIIIGIFAFAAIATPSTDPLTMLFLAVPMTVLYFVSEVVARTLDRRKAKAAPSATADDEASDIDLGGDPDDDLPGKLD